MIAIAILSGGLPFDSIALSVLLLLPFVFNQVKKTRICGAIDYSCSNQNKIALTCY